MDDNTRQVLIAALSALGGLVTGLLVAFAGFDRAARLERERWHRDDRIRSEERWQDQKRTAFVRLVGASYAIAGLASRVDAGHRVTIPESFLILQEAMVAATDVRILVPDLGELAGELPITAHGTLDAAINGRGDAEKAAANDAWLTALRAFLDAADPHLKR